MTESSPPPGAPAKADPEALVLRAPRSRIVRFRRGVIVALTASAAIAVAGISWLALQPPSWRLVADGDDGPRAVAAPPDALAGAPKSYGEVPRLGPPLPGDLGRPILARQREIAAATEDPSAAAQAQQAETERQRVLAERLAARQSGVMMPISGSSAQLPSPLGGRPEAAPRSPPDDPPDEQMSPRGERASAAVGRSNTDGTVNPHRLTAAPSPYALLAGSVIAASLITGLNSDLPGFITAQVTENAYDTVTGQILLVPQGSRLVGSYDNVVAFGQSRALVVWQRIILPDGSSIQIDNVPATDMSGFAGLSDRVDRHTWQLLKGVVLSTLLGVGSELSFGNTESDLVRAIRQSAQQSGARAGEQLVTRNLNVQPTLRVRSGWPLRVVVHRDIVLEPWRGGRG
ncbi:TrbI/VirB10 family protein [Sphingosinicella sp. LHD-64]|uniref:TrbI/VirB10 family protein n=1 Tax=Sphingosinicella sp. LHD-64 TaxID=3072139 RepID=UPI00280C78D4|nr:TrbI/VirB10 family protein [Sphingosinicella sp. LHD-64]MDQ8757487.1 TrbI/VirB10 family protein [Sphingosinicella sp. LHD-64]